MSEFADTVRKIEETVEKELSGWPLEWQGFNWPGYTYEHTLRVRNLSLAMARRLGADVRIVELATLLHDIGKPAGEPHAAPGAERAALILAELGIDAESRQRVCHVIAGHLDCNPADPLENLVLYDADFIDANYGCIAFMRYITIRGHRGNAIPDMAAEAQGWLSRLDERRGRVITAIGQSIAGERFARMQLFHRALVNDLGNGADNEGGALGIARYLVADAHRPSLSRQVREISSALDDSVPWNGLRPSAFLRKLVGMLKQEIAGEG